MVNSRIPVRLPLTTWVRGEGKLLPLRGEESPSTPSQIPPWQQWNGVPCYSQALLDEGGAVGFSIVFGTPVDSFQLSPSLRCGRDEKEIKRMQRSVC